MSICWAIIPGADVFLSRDSNWTDLCKTAEQDERDFDLCDDFYPAPTKDLQAELYPVPARALGTVYQGDRLQKHWEDLAFPLYDALAARLQEEGILPSTVLVFLTETTEAFSCSQREFTDCPFWADTIKLKEILDKYFLGKVGVRPNFCRLAATVPEKLHSGEEMMAQIYRHLSGYESETTILSASSAPPVIQATAALILAKYFRPAKLLVPGIKWYYKAQFVGELIDVL